jgi:hypothetical protein
MASNKITPAIKNSSGTSYSAPRVAHKLALIQADLSNIGIEHISASLLRAFAINSASYQDENSNVRHFIQQLDVTKRHHWLNVLGYGFPDELRAVSSDPYSALFYFQGELPPDQIAFFGIPVPAALANAIDGKKRLTVTVAYAPEVQQWGLERYLGVSFKWRIFRGDINPETVIAAMSTEAEDEDQNDVVAATANLISEDKATSSLPGELQGSRFGIQRRSKGTIQHDVYEWNTHQSEYSTHFYTLAIASFQKWQRRVSPVPYAVVVRLEDLSRSCEIYTEIQNLIEVSV